MSEHLTTTVMFADICRSTQLFETLGDDAAADLVGKLLSGAASSVEAQDGVVLRTKGDDVLCILDHPENALQAASSIHRATSELARSEGTLLAMRIGLHYGQVILSDGDLLGDTVNVAARLCSLAKAGQTIVTSETVDRLSHLPRGLVRPLGGLSVKGKAGPLRLFEFIDSDQEDEITLVGKAVTEFPRSTHLTIRHGSRQDRLDYLLVRYLFGRAPDCDLILEHPQVSRHHAEIRYRNNEFVLIDFSTNGTKLILDGRPRAIHHSQAALRGSGSIFLGHTVYNRRFEIAFHATGGTRGFSQTRS